jgi:hypothetical protein
LPGARGNRHESFRSPDQISYKLLGPGAEGKFHPAVSAEQVGYHRKLTVDHVGKKQSRSAQGNNPAVNFRNFQIRINLRVYFKQFRLLFQDLQKCRQVFNDP